MTAARDSLPPPHDEALPVAATLLDAAAMTPHLATLFGAEVDTVRVRYLDYLPGQALTVQYDARRGGVLVEAHASTVGDHWTVSAYPDDPSLPLLAADGRTLGETLRVDALDAPVTRLAWVPRRRAALRCGHLVVKLYADPDELRSAERALRAIAGRLPTAELIAAHPDRGAVVQQALAGRPLDRPDATASAGAAAAILRRLHGSTLVGLDDIGPAALLAATRRPVALGAFAVPGLAGRLRTIVEQLGERLPEPTATVPVHGDFNLGQLLDDGDRTWVVDVDTLAAGSPSVDLAAYAANLHNGRSGDDAQMRSALDALVEAYGRQPIDLTWHLAATLTRRVDRPIRRLKKHWPERTEAIVAAIEGLLGQGLTGR